MTEEANIANGVWGDIRKHILEIAARDENGLLEYIQADIDKLDQNAFLNWISENTTLRLRLFRAAANEWNLDKGANGRHPKDFFDPEQGDAFLKAYRGFLNLQRQLQLVEKNSLQESAKEDEHYYESAADKSQLVGGISFAIGSALLATPMGIQLLSVEFLTLHSETLLSIGMTLGLPAALYWGLVITGFAVGIALFGCFCYFSHKKDQAKTIGDETRKEVSELNNTEVSKELCNELQSCRATLFNPSNQSYSQNPDVPFNKGYSSFGKNKLPEEPNLRENLVDQLNQPLTPRRTV